MEKSKDTRTQLLTENPWKLMLSLSLPAIIGMVVIGLYNFMDAIFVGNMISSVAMTAVKVSYRLRLSTAVLQRCLASALLPCFLGRLANGIKQPLIKSWVI